MNDLLFYLGTAANPIAKFMCPLLVAGTPIGVVIYIYWTLRRQDFRKRQQVLAKYSQEYEQRKLTIGTIKCSQCEWSGQWGTGMSYEQFFAGDLAEHEIYVGRSKGEKSSLSLNNRQYECPVCNSLSWKKV